VEALNTTTIRRLTPSCRHQLLAIARVFQHLFNSFLGVALNRLNRYVYDVAYGLPQWPEISTFNYGYAPSDDSVAEAWPNEPYQIQLYAEVAKAGQAAARWIEPTRLSDLAMFNLAIDSKLRGCDLVRLRIDDVFAGGSVIGEAD
jgi:hypothetical protein